MQIPIKTISLIITVTVYQTIRDHVHSHHHGNHECCKLAVVWFRSYWWYRYVGKWTI